MAKTFYKRGRFGNRPPCLICMDRGEGERRLLHLPHGVSVWLCAAHRSPEFQTRRGGRDLMVSLAWAWQAAGCHNSSRQRALAVLERRVGSGAGGRPRPGSYAWPALRREAEGRFAAGEPPAAVIHDLRLSADAGPAVAPSVRTMRRWFAEGRWLRPGGATVEPPPSPDGSSSTPIPALRDPSAEGPRTESSAEVANGGGLHELGAQAGEDRRELRGAVGGNRCGDGILAFDLSQGSPSATTAAAASPTAASSALAATAESAGTGLTIGQIYSVTAAGVVEIQVASRASGSRGLQGPVQGQATQSQGSGFVIDDEGHIVTNAHVVEGATEISVIFDDGTQAAASLVGSDASSDLAVIRVDAGAIDLTPLPLTDSDQVRVGDEVVAISSPFGLENTATAGIVSALGRSDRRARRPVVRLAPAGGPPAGDGHRRRLRLPGARLMAVDQLRIS